MLQAVYSSYLNYMGDEVGTSTYWDLCCKQCTPATSTTWEMRWVLLGSGTYVASSVLQLPQLHGRRGGNFYVLGPMLQAVYSSYLNYLGDEVGTSGWWDLCYKQCTPATSTTWETRWVLLRIGTY